VNSASDAELLTFWAQIFEKQIRTGDHLAKMTIVHIVRQILPGLKPSLFRIVVGATFIKMVNSLMKQPMEQEAVFDFLSAVVEFSAKSPLLYAESFKYVDYALSGTAFHRHLFEKCSISDLEQLFQEVVDFSDVDAIDLRQRFSVDRISDRTVSAYRLDTARALLITSAQFPHPELSIAIFDFLREAFPDQLTLLVSDLVEFDLARVEGSATFQDLLKDESVSHFEACYQLYSICAGATSSPSLDRLIAPDVAGAVPSVDFIVVAIQNSGEPALIRHAFKMHLQEILPLIDEKDLEQFFASYTPLTETFSQPTVEMFRFVLEHCNFSLNFTGPLFELFCKTITNIGLTLGQLVAEMLTDGLPAEGGAFDFPQVIRSLFGSMSGLSKTVLNSNERLIVHTFNHCLGAVIKAAAPLSPKFIKSLETQLDAAMANFAFKTNPHFSENVFTAFLQLPDNVSRILFPVALKHLPNVHRVHRRVMLLNLISRILEPAKAVDVLEAHGEAFNHVVLALLGEDFIQNKDNEKNFVKTLAALNRWLALIERKRSACAAVNVAEFKRKLTSIAGQSRDPVQSHARQILATLQKVEAQVHPKHRHFV
jgi:hypothetical protein